MGVAGCPGFSSGSPVPETLRPHPSLQLGLPLALPALSHHGSPLSLGPEGTASLETSCAGRFATSDLPYLFLLPWELPTQLGPSNAPRYLQPHHPSPYTWPSLPPTPIQPPLLPELTPSQDAGETRAFPTAQEEVSPKDNPDLGLKGRKLDTSHLPVSTCKKARVQAEAEAHLCCFLQ